MIPSKAVPLLQQALQLHQKGRLDQAFSLYAQVRKLAPRCVEAHHFAGEIALSKGDFSQALLLLTQALRINPANTACSIRLGQALILSGRLEQAVTVLTHAVHNKPSDVALWGMLSTAFRKLGKIQEAISACESAVLAAPQSAQAEDQLGALLVEAVGHSAGEPHFRKATELDPKEATYWCNLGICLAYRKDITTAIPCFDTALQLDPLLAKAYAGRGLTRERLYQIPEAVADYRKAIELNPHAWDARSCLLLNLHYLPGIAREDLFIEHQAYGRALQESLGNKPAARTTRPALQGRLIKVGFFTPDFRAHSVAYFMEPLLRHLDRSRFEIHLYHDHASVDWMTDIIRPLAQRWHHTAGLPHESVQKIIQNDSLDILFDLTGHTGFNRLPLFGQRLAPIQATYLGYPDTTGLSTMDFRLTDEYADPAGQADHFATEKLLRFSPSAWCYAPSARAPHPTAPPCLSQEGGRISFGCFNNFTKITDPLLKLWGRLLNAVPASMLILKNHGLDDPVQQSQVLTRFVQQGLDPARVTLLGRTERMEDHLGTYSRIDIALDTFPYHGTTTTCEALWMGVPVVVLAGDRHASRVGCSLLSNTGHPEWIAQCEDEYIAIASRLAADQTLLSSLRSSLRSELANSLLCNAPLQAAHLGKAIEQMTACSRKLD